MARKLRRRRRKGGKVRCVPRKPVQEAPNAIPNRLPYWRILGEVLIFAIRSARSFWLIIRANLDLDR